MNNNWSDEELEAAVIAYTEMYQKELHNETFQKKSYYAELSKKYGRTEKSFEYRMQNISYVYSEMGRDFVSGLKPAKNVGANVTGKIEELIKKVEAGGTKPKTTSFLYNWNPGKWNWSDLQEAVYKVNNEEDYSVYWSCGTSTKKIKVGDMFYLMRLGIDPKGIVGCGYICSTPYPLPHWDEEKRAKGETALRTDIIFKVLSASPIVSLEDLTERYPEYNWTPRKGGVTIPDEIATELLSQVMNNKHHEFEQQSVEEVRLYSEGRVKAVTYKSYDRSPEARQECLKHFGYSCRVCDFKFEDKYGELGRDYIEVHHLKPISEIGKEYEVNPIEDLRPVCANCHRMLHMKKPALSIEELESLIQSEME